ncbi:SAF domain-containing protein [Sulfobacillus harzensis]|uniref:SAF domain-containing protein n=1 Tax=Sulfobacillus harzensis TaxID=2729629 RepID=A0A7Y0L3K0_9FIRM|nr:SAF domain-containing protein [Sulfobacillus harzensis]NMP22570.1 hypothetical protein [Sulfobacillus harzensis]
MKGAIGRLQERAGLAAFVAAALVFMVLSVVPRRQPQALLVPVLRHDVAAGTRLSASDIRWVKSTRIHGVEPASLVGYAKTPLFAGEIVSPVDVGARPPSGAVVVAVAPADSADVTVAAIGRQVDILAVLKNGQLAWQSGPVTVVGLSHGASVQVAMPLTQAIAYERQAFESTIELVGMER